jgi:hypothetical protein
MAQAPIVIPGSKVAPPPDRSSNANTGYCKSIRMLFTTWKAIVREGDIGAYKHIVFKSNTIPQLNTGFDGDSVTYNYVIFNQAVRADIGICTDLCARKNDNKLPNARAVTNVLALHICKRMNFNCQLSLLFKSDTI